MRWKDVVGPGEAFHTARVTYSRRRPVPYHRHDFAEVFWVDEGRGLHRVNGQRQPLEAGTLVFMRPEDAHSIEAGTDQMLRFTNIAFASSTRDFLGERYFAKKDGAWWHKKTLPETRQIDARQRTLLNRWADELARSSHGLLAIERFLMNVLGELSESAEQRLPPNTPDWLAHACREIRQSEHLPGGTAAFLKLAGRGREHTARSMQKYLGVSPTDYVNRIRMEHAAHLLEMSNRSILEIAGDCGTENLSHFYKLFREVHQATPRAYREAHRRPV